MPLHMSAKTLAKIIGSIVAAVVVGLGAWLNMKADLVALNTKVETRFEDHSKQLTTIQTTLGADHDQLKVQGTMIEGVGKAMEKMDRKLDYLTGARSIRPSAGPNGGGTASTP